MHTNTHTHTVCKQYNTYTGNVDYVIMRFTLTTKWDILSAKQPFMSVLKGATQHIGAVWMKGLQCVERLLLSFWKKKKWKYVQEEVVVV